MSQNLTNRLKKIKRRLVARTAVALAPLVFSLESLVANPKSIPEKINSPKYAEEVKIDQSGYKHWRFGDVWYSNTPLKEYSEDKEKSLSKTSTDYEDIRMDPFTQPNDSNLVWYGSGDLNGDNQRTKADADSILAKHGPVDQANINGNGTSFEASDYTLFQNFIQDFSKFLPGDWNKIGSTENYPEKLNSWFDKTATIDPTSEIPYVYPEFICSDFARKTGPLNFHGFGEITKDSSLINELDPLGRLKDYSDNGRFNMPVFYVSISSEETGLNHAIICALTNYQGQGPLDFSNWRFKEPQDDSNVFPGDYSMPNDSRVKIYHSFFFYHEPTNKFYFGQEPFIEFKLTEGAPEFIKNDDRLILQRPYVNSIKPEKLNLLEKFVLNQNYPNPFNSSTTINYSIPLEDKVKLQVYDVQGKLVKTLVNEKQRAGEYSIDLNSQGLSSGIYIYRLNGEGSRINKTGKMTLVK
ncbi:MAG: T9SS type A sorting domain-containing protein [Nanoarchaeota archaeon]|nr:T9SS type A sorting domain-containing protein [Nanoarchaeota archaeon]